MAYPYTDETEYAPSQAYQQAPPAQMGAAPSTINRFASAMLGGRSRQRPGSAPPGPPPVTNATSYDPSNPATQLNHPGGADLGANNGFNNANMWSQYQAGMGQLRGDTEARRTAATGSRAAADASREGRPSYGGIPQWNAPDPYVNDQTRPDISDDWDENQARYTASIGANGGPVSTRDTGAGSVAGGGAAFRDYATGAGNMFLKDFNRNLRLQTDNAAGRGRLNTGFYDEDTGVLAQRMGSDFNDQLQMKALDAARLDQDAAVGNADRYLTSDMGNADRSLRGAQGNQMYGSRQGEFLMDYQAGREDAAGAAYEDDRNFGRGNYENDRGFGRDVYADDRNFGYGVSRDETADWENDRNFDEDRYRYDDAAATDTQNRYMDAVSGAASWRTDQGRYEDAQRGSFGRTLGQIGKVVAPIVGTALGGPLGGMLGGALGGMIGGGGGAQNSNQIGAGGFTGAGSGYRFPSFQSSYQPQQQAPQSDFYTGRFNYGGR